MRRRSSCFSDSTRRASKHSAALLARGTQATYQEALAILCRDAEGTCFVYRFSDPTYVMAEALLQAIGQHADAGGLPSGSLRRHRAPDPRAGRSSARRQHGACRPLFLEALARQALHLAGMRAGVLRRQSATAVRSRRVLAGRPRGCVPLHLAQAPARGRDDAALPCSDGVVVMPHLHSALGENFSAGNTLTPAAYRDLFASRQPRLFSDERLLTQVLERRWWT